MTNYQGIAAVTRTLGYLASSAIRVAVPEARVTLARPEEPAAGAANEPRLNIYLIQVSPAATMRSNDLPTRDEHGRLLNAPQAPVNLRYLLSFFGSSEKAQLMLGATELALRARAVLDPALIRQALAQHPELQGSGLEQQAPPVRIVPSPVTLEELSRFWSGFLQTPYTVSTVYDAMTVILTSELAPHATLPVRQVGGARSGLPPQLDPLAAVQFTTSRGGTRVPVSGSGLGLGQQVDVGGRWAALEPAPGGGLQFTLPPGTVAGPVEVQLGAAADGEVVPRTIAGSRPQLLAVRPQLRAVRVDQAGRTCTVTIAPAVRAGQQAVLSLVSTGAGGGLDGSDPPSAQIVTTVASTGSQLHFEVPARLPDGEYLAVIELDGVSSLPAVVGGRYAQPAVELSR